MDYHNTQNEICQDVILDNELQSKFRPKKQASELLALSYERIGYEGKAQRVSECGTYLEFRRPLDVAEPPTAKPEAAEAVGTSEGWKLHNANFCRDRLCPMCSWRRSYKIFAQISQIMNFIQDKYCYLFLTLTVPNCSADELADTVDQLQEGWQKLKRYKRFSTAVKGYFKVLETTRNTDKSSKSYNTYHPHLHCILAVERGYFKGGAYIKRDEWLAMWQKAMRDPTITQVDIRRCKAKEEIQEGEQAVKALGSAVAEVAKYSVKSADFLGRFNKDGFLIAPFPDEEIDEAVVALGSALHGRRLVALGGVFDEVFKKLQLDDCESGDLIHIEGSEVRADVAYMIRRYNWSCGAYKLLEERREVNVDIEVYEE